MHFHIVSLGCPKNRVDSERYAWVLKKAGFTQVIDPDKADLIVLNTCAFIAPATEESVEHLEELIHWKSGNPERQLILAGCLPGRYKDDGSGGLEDIDLILGPEDWKGLARWLGVKFPGSALVSGRGSHRYLKIAEGCSNGCSFCTIPLIRGGFRSVGYDDILMEADLLASQGAGEIGLVAQDSGRWKCGNTGLTDLAATLADLHPDIWFRLYYLHPARFPRDMEQLFAGHPNIVPYVDMPVQHASSAVLKRMGRGYDEKQLRSIMERIESAKAEIAVRYTVITGYPGETQSDFEILRTFLGDYPSGRHIAAFSWYPEEGTLEFQRTIDNKDAVPDGVASERLAALSAVGDSLYAQWDEKLLHRRIDVLADDSETGHTIWDAPEVDSVVSFTEPVRTGERVTCEVVDSSGAVIVAEPVNE